MPLQGARARRGDDGREEPPEDETTELTELELSAVGEAMNQMMAAAANATSAVLGTEVEIAPPDTRVLTSLAERSRATRRGPRHERRLHRLRRAVPARPAGPERVRDAHDASALDEQGTEQLSGDAGLSALGIAGRAEAGQERALDDALRDIRVRVWAELGRTRVSLGAAPQLPPGAVLELDRKADDPVDLYVNGLRFGSGRLVLTDEGEWALRLEEVAGQGFRPPAIASESPPGDVTTEVM
jgi:flagellar motor switch protein FliN/FliY